MTGKLILTRGIPGSGKTTWATSWLAEAPDDRLRVNRDDLRRMLHAKSYGLSWSAEKAITDMQISIVKAAISRGIDVVVDDTNLRAKFVRQWLSITPDVEFRDFPIELTVAIERDALRDHSVGAEVITRFWDKFTVKGKLPPAPEATTQQVEGAWYEPDWGLDQAYIFDIDGTLAHITEGGRSPYDGDRVHEDSTDEAVAGLLRHLNQTFRTVIVSGRDSKYRAVTEKWLTDNLIPFDELHMRPEGDTRKDHTVKLEIFDQQLRNRLNVLGVFDDRNRVVEMWRSIGLKCFQVQEGNF